MKINKILIAGLLCFGIASIADARQRQPKPPQPTGGTTSHPTITSSVATVPDSGGTVALFGLALTGIAATRRLARARKA